jgi:hypothetical protein
MSDSPSPDPRVEELVGMAMKVATLHGASLALADLLQLLPSEASRDEVARALETSPSLKQMYNLRDGLVVPKASTSDTSSSNNERARSSSTNTLLAHWLASRVGPSAVVMAVSGSTSYRSASWEDDVDLFCVIRAGFMWPFIAKTLVLTRMSRITGGKRAPICLSCIMDWNYARHLFRSDRGGLMARDALVADVLVGETEYQSLIETASWMSRYFPKLYELRGGRGAPPSVHADTGVLGRVLNLFLYATLGTFIKAKARIHNLSLAKKGRTLARFEAKVGVDHLIYESAKYLKTKELYDSVHTRPSALAGGMEVPGPR